MSDQLPWTDEITVSKSGVPYPNHSNIVVILQHDPLYAAHRVWYDEFLDRVYFANSPVREWRDEDDTRVTVDIQDRFGIRGVSRHVVADAVRLVAHQRPRHVIRDWLSSLVWDGEPRIALSFTDHWQAASDEYTWAASKNFYVGMVARILNPGCKLDTMPVFEGEQGTKKSTALEILGGEWYSISHESIGTKDFLQGLRGKWLLEIAELHSFAKADIRAIKNTLSTRNDDYRKSHGRNVQRYPRECVFAGTTNVDDWGTDETGLRRFWPIACGDIQTTALRAVRDQLFAEAVVCFKASATWWDMPQSTEAIQADRQSSDEWAPVIAEWCRVQRLTDRTAGVLVRDIVTKALGIPLDRCDKKIQMRVARVLRIAKWERKKQRNGEATDWMWFQGENILEGGNGGNIKFPPD